MRNYTIKIDNNYNPKLSKYYYFILRVLSQRPRKM